MSKADPHSRRKQYKAYARYSGIGFQLIAFILIGVFVGGKLDKYFATSQPIYTLITTFIFLCMGLFFVVRELLKK